MEILTDPSSSGPVLLPNAEVMEMLEKSVKKNKNRMDQIRKKARKKHHTVENKYEHRDWIESEVLKYLKSTPASSLPASRIPELKSKCMGSKQRRLFSPSSATAAEGVPSNPTQSTTAKTSYGLTEAETLQILNFMPKEPVEIHLMVEELQARMSETQQDEFLAMIQSYCTANEHDNTDKNNKNSGKGRDNGGDDEKVDDETTDEIIVKEEGEQDNPINEEIDDSDNEVVIENHHPIIKEEP